MIIMRWAQQLENINHERVNKKFPKKNEPIGTGAKIDLFDYVASSVIG